MTKHSKAQGFTIIELMVTLAILGLALSIGAPSFQAFIQKTRIQNEAETLYALLNQARQAAASQGNAAFLCRSAAINPAIPTCQVGAGNSNWNTAKTLYSALIGMTIPASGNNFDNLVIQGIGANSLGATAAERLQMLIKVASQPNGTLTVTSNNQDNVIAFSGDGTLVNGAPLRIAICDNLTNSENFGRYIEINQVGRLQLRTTTAPGTPTDCTPD